MITQIEIDGFKTFTDFKVELAPFQVIVGPNGSGKSNLFDALQLLSALVETDLYSAFQKVRGPGELFTKYADGSSSDRIRIAVEMLVDRKAKDMLEREITLNYTRLRYEVEIVQDIDESGSNQLYIKHELLKTIPKKEEKWLTKNTSLSNSQLWEESSSIDEQPFTFFSFTKSDAQGFLRLNFKREIFLKERNLLEEYIVEVNKGRDRVLLGSNATSSMRHANAVCKELSSLKFLHLHPDSLRKYSPINTPHHLAADGSNLPATLAHMQRTDKLLMPAISRQMANLVPGILKIKVELDKLTNQYVLQAKTRDQRTFSSQALSDGTLRLLALVTLKNDPQFQGTICIEEPENGVDSLHLSQVAHLLQSMATDLTDPERADEPLKQVLVTTHSPVFIALPEVIESVLFAFKVSRVEPRKRVLQVTRMMPVLPDDTDNKENVSVEAYTINQIIKYLARGKFDEARERLERARDITLKGKEQ